MKIFTTFDCIKLNEFEKIILLVIKGLLYDANHASEGHYLHKDSNKIITVKPTDNNSKDLTTFHITNSYPGLFKDLKKIIEPFSFGMKVQGGNKEDGSTSIILQKFKIKRETLNYYTI